MQRHLKYLLAAMLLTCAVLTVPAIPKKPVPQRLVNDYCGILDYSQRIALERKLTAFNDSTSNQITVVTVEDLEGLSASEYATELGHAWGVGSEKSDNGIVVLVKPKTADSPGQVNISVGYGLEGAIPDSYAKRIVSNEMIPAFQKGDYYTGIDNACSVLMKLASGEISEPPGMNSGASMWLLLIVLIIIISVIRSRNKGGGNNSGGGKKFINDKGDFIKGLIIGSILNDSGGSRHYHHDGFGGGDFGGFGGGFGGFGGGDFGGGGASGSW